MKFLICILFLLAFSLPAEATYVPNSAATVNTGASYNSPNATVSAPLTDWIGTGSYTRVRLVAGASATTDAGFYGFSIQGGSTGHYKVPSGKVLSCPDLSYTNQGSQHYVFGYATADFTEATGSTPTGQNCFAESCNRFHGYVLVSTFGKYETKSMWITYQGDQWPNVNLGKDGIEGWSLELDCFLK